MSNDWIQELEQKKQSLYLELTQSPSFQAEFPATLTPVQFVDGLSTKLGKALPQGERDRLVAATAAGAMSRANVLREILERWG